MTGKIKSGAQGNGKEAWLQQEEWLLELLLPGLFTLILLGCLLHIGYCVLQAERQPVAGFQYAISAGNERLIRVLDSIRT